MLNSTIFDYTFSYSKYSCIKEFYLIHVFLSYMSFIFGILAILTRILFKNYHSIFGRSYMLSILWNTASSLLIHNNGLPLVVLFSFLWVLGCMTIGYILIVIYKHKTFHNFLHMIDIFIQNKDRILIYNHIEKIYENKRKYLVEKRNLFVIKGFHGTLMFVSWFNISGRIFFSEVNKDFKCYTYPIYKENGNIVPMNDPNYNNLIWANNEIIWGINLYVIPFFIGMLMISCLHFFNL